MRKPLLFVALLSLLLAPLLMAAEPVNLIRFTLINKSGIDIAVQLFSADYENVYYLKVPEGSRQYPTTKTFTIAKDIYQMQVFYIETYDPVYGYSCGNAPPTTLFATRQMKVVLTECGELPPNRGEPTMMKYWYWFRRRNPPGFIY